MDCYFNKYIPESDNKRIILRPTSKTFVNGMAASYDTDYNPKLKEYISERQYNYVIHRIVDELTMMWPCCFCFTYGYLFSVCTIGLSFLFPAFCIKDAKRTLLKTIKAANEQVFIKRGLLLSYQQQYSTSWLQIDILEKEDKLLKQMDFEETDHTIVKNQVK